MNLAMIFVSIPCINFIAVAVMAIGMIYLWIYVSGKAYAVVHEIGHAVFNKQIYVPGNDDKLTILKAYSASKKTGRGFPQSAITICTS